MLFLSYVILRYVVKHDLLLCFFIGISVVIPIRSLFGVETHFYILPNKF